MTGEALQLIINGQEKEIKTIQTARRPGVEGFVKPRLGWVLLGPGPNLEFPPGSRLNKAPSFLSLPGG
jgi:hypothetical protein